METHELVSTDDARVWARQFVEMAQTYRDVPFDAATMEGWFANAMCAARDCDARRRARAATELTPAQKALEEKTGTPDSFAQAVWAAHAQLFCTTAEALTAIAKYRQEWLVAGDVPDAKEA
jgi:hypothetical protein